MNTQVKNYSDVAAKESLDDSNKNISSVLSQIQDDGPAYSETKERDKLVKLQMKDKQKQKLHDASHNEFLEKDIYTREALLNSANFGSGSSDKKKTWIQYTVVLFLTVCIMFFMYQMDNRANKIEELLSDYDEDIQDTVDSYSKKSPVIVQLNSDLASMKNELKLINSNTEIQETEKMGDIDIQDEIVSSLEDEIQILKMQLIKVNKDLNIQISKNESTTIEGNGNESVDSEKQLENSWRVNLAALSNKRKVDEIVSKLSTDGLILSVDEVTVNGQLIYRLSVGGFSKFEQAELFVVIAEEEYGMKGGWIKKVSNG